MTGWNIGIRCAAVDCEKLQELKGNAQACGLSVGQREFAVLLRDGRRVVVPFACFPRLERATPEQRRHFEVYADGKMLHWPDLDEDIEVQHIVDGRMPIKLAEPLAV